MDDLKPASSPIPFQAFQYRSVEGTRLNIFHFPAQTEVSDPAPAIVYFYGGGWVGGRVSHLQPQAEYFASLGVSGFLVHYRVVSRDQSTPFDSVSDAQSAVRWVREHAEKFNVNPNKIVAMGGSAGGHLAGACAILSADSSPGVSCIPNALALLNPVTDTTQSGYGSKLIGDRCEELSLTHHIRQKLPPSIVLHGTADTIVPFENSERFCRLLVDSGNDTELVSYPEKGHGFFNYQASTDSKPSEDFLDTLTRIHAFLNHIDFLDSPPIVIAFFNI
ncbi:MAG: alpha/beta hydrolase [Verrucomicrobiota bacterium]